MIACLTGGTVELVIASPFALLHRAVSASAGFARFKHECVCVYMRPGVMYVCMCACTRMHAS